MLHPAAFEVAECVYALALRRPNVTTVARAMGMTSRQLERKVSKGRLPPPLRLVVLVRWYAVARLVTHVRVRTSVAAKISGFSSIQAYCRAARRELQIPAKALRSSVVRQQIGLAIVEKYGAPRRVAKWAPNDAIWPLRVVALEDNMGTATISPRG